MSDYMANQADLQIDGGLAKMQEAYETYCRVKRRRRKPYVRDWVLLSEWSDADPRDAWRIGQLTDISLRASGRFDGEVVAYYGVGTSRLFLYARKFENKEEAMLVKKYMEWFTGR